jgi:hypothetical protein
MRRAQFGAARAVPPWPGKVGLERRIYPMGTKKKNNQNNATELARATQLIAGVQKHLANLSTLKFASADHTPAEVTTSLQDLVALHTAVEAARTVVKAKLAALRANAPALRKEMAGLVSFVMLAFSESPDVLADFGLEPKKPRTPLTTADQAVANAKRTATLAANGTTDKVAKKGKKGDVVDVVMTPVKVAPVVATPTAPSTTGNGGATGGSASHGGA